MAITKKQKELDELKWLKSEELGQDACGTFDYCAACDKTLENPCDKAYRKTHAKPKVKKAAEPTGKKPATHRSSAKKDAAVKAPAEVWRRTLRQVPRPAPVPVPAPAPALRTRGRRIRK